MKRETLAGVLMIVVAIVIYWCNVQMEEQEDTAQANMKPEFTASSFKTRSFDDNGRLSAKLAARKMQHYDLEKFTELVEPVYFLYPVDSQRTWKLSAKEGTIKQNRHITLSNNVIITAIDPNKPFQTLKTGYLELDLDTMIVTSTEPVVAQGLDFSMQATGLWADLNLNQFKLENKVSASYEPN